MKHNNKRMPNTEVGGKVCDFRSRLEYTVARYLQLLKEGGHMHDWLFENTNFQFPDDRYLIDFDVLENEGSVYYLEAKAYFDARSRRKLTLLDKYRPEVRIMLVMQNKAGIKKLGRAREYCWRVCLLSELTRGIV